MNTNGAFLLSLSKAKPFLKVVCTNLASSHRGQKIYKKLREGQSTRSLCTPLKNCGFAGLQFFSC